ncbi:protein yellow-like [Cloeon dipterum]|uniref:protein yellow-like n=1 Tax=Cloeon dipterum TaxID=197152 RepID=UPI00321FF694
MTPFFLAIFVLGLSSVAVTANFTRVFEWPAGLDYEWPSEAGRTQALEDGTFKPNTIQPLFMAVHGGRIFISLLKWIGTGVPVTLVTLPTTNTSSVPPKLTPYPSWDMHEEENCSKIQRAHGLEVDAVGRLWVLDSPSKKCPAKLWIFNLADDTLQDTHEFTFKANLHDLVLDETPDGWFAYMTRTGAQHIVVFSLKTKETRLVETPALQWTSIALKKEPKQLYLSRNNLYDLYSVSVDALMRDQTANLEAIGNWNAFYSYRMLIDSAGTLYSAFHDQKYISSYNTSRKFQEQRFHEFDNLDSYWPFVLALDQNDTLWMTVFGPVEWPKCRLLKAVVSDASPGAE